MKIIRAIFKLENSEGHLKWTVAQLSRKTHLSRATIYLYFGQSKNAIVRNALTFICEDYFGTNEKRVEQAQRSFLEAAKYTRALFDETPEFAVFYQNWRYRASEYRDIIEAFEKDYRKKLKRLHPAKSSDEIIFLHAVLHGLITAPFLDSHNFEYAVNRLSSI